jgi:hypothetical protein
MALFSKSTLTGATVSYFWHTIVLIQNYRFQAVKGACHSTGAMYATVGNTPRLFRYLREETILLLMFPGPHEPTQEQYNNLMEICVEHFKRLYNGIWFMYFVSLRMEFTLIPGVSFDVHGQDDPEIFHIQIGSDVSDLPASRKTSGLLACTSKYFMTINPLYSCG